MLELKVGVQLRSLRMPLRQALLTAAKLGAAAVEIDARSDLPLAEASQTAIRQIRKDLDDLRLRVSAVAFPTRRGYGDPANLDRRVEGTKQAMELAFRLGAPIVVNQAGHAPDDLDSPEGRLLLEALTDLGHYGQRVGALLAAETGLDAPQDLARLISAMPVGSLTVDYDPAALLLSGHDPLEALKLLGSHVMHVHVRDAVHDARPGAGAEVELGRGLVDWQAVLAGLEEKNYRGYLTLRRDGSRNPEAELALAVSYMRRLWN